ITLEILHHLREIESRRLFTVLGYPSLFEYAVRDLGYSAGSAYRRLSAMRALEEGPAIEEAIEMGKLTVSTVSQVQSFFKAERLQNKRIYTPTEKRELFLSLENKTSIEVEKKLAELS